MLFPWLEYLTKKKPELIKDNSALIKEIKSAGVKDNNILLAMENVPREFFVEQKFLHRAYENIPLPIGCGQTISQPYIIAFMISCLGLKDTYNVLEIGTGSGYQTAILAHLCKNVCSIEIHKKLLDKAKKNITKLNLKNVTFKLGNGVEGWQNKDFFNAIIICAASEKIPTKLLENLKDQGVLIMPKKDSSENQKLLLIKKNKERYIEKELFGVKFVPLLDKDIEL